MASMSIKMGTRQYCVLTTSECQTTVVESKAVFKSQRIGGRKRRNFYDSQSYKTALHKTDVLETGATMLCKVKRRKDALN
jgi:hypothetical protein